MTKLFFASKNKDKIIKMKNRLKNLPIKVLTPYDLDINIDIDENGTNVIENATLKAKAYCEKVKTPTVATDSSLYVEKFKHQPGLFVKRINGVELSEDDLEKHYINELNKIGGKSSAYYITGLVLVQNNNVNSIEIKEDDFIFTSDRCEDRRSYDPLSRLEYDIKMEKYFCQLTADEMDSRGYRFDKKVRDFIERNLKCKENLK